MTKPVYAIRTYTGANLDHTITTEAINPYFKEIITDGVGYFSFTVPTVKGIPDPYYYNDIALNDTVKIWMGHNSVDPDGDTPNFIGKVGKITVPLSTQSGYLRMISGLSQGEILLRRFKTNKRWEAVGASTIVTELADDLSLGNGDVQVDATAVTLEVRTKTYFDLLREISDYWYDAGTQIKKDFWVDLDGDLYWHTRPFRTVGVETLTVGDNIVSYQVLRDMEAVKNYITVYGAPEEPQPSDRDGWTEDTTDGWTEVDGTLSAVESVSAQVGDYYLYCINAGENSCKFYRTFSALNCRNAILRFYEFTSLEVGITVKVRLYAPDSSNYFEADVSLSNDSWAHKELNLGYEHEYSEACPNGIWTKTGTPSWFQISGIEFEATKTNGEGSANLNLDGLHFDLMRFSATVEDGDSQTDYSQRDFEVIDDKLHSDGDCQKRAETLLYQMKDPPIQIGVTTPLNMNILVGDRLSMTIPAEGISSANYDVISVESSISLQGAITRATMVNSANIRKSISSSDPIKMLGDLNRQLRELSMDEKFIK